ncbi:MAG: SUMF1/EgtB/PvdO family nonheme iron enzyme [Candidatus Brocadia sp.]|nr:SUMF1/EgtB/PvdO family nonheme iron enzyme [Candidatus Brocadia sp.]
MACLHAWRGGSLPEKREELYADTVDLLLDWWESQRIVRDSEGNPKNPQPSLTEWLRVDQKKVRHLLNELAFKAHQSQPEAVGTADIPMKDLVSGLMDISQNPDVKYKRLVEYLSDRAGILIPRSVKVFTFAHRTFQEYLAACHLTDDDFPEKLAHLARTEPNRWREVTLLAGAKAAGGSAYAIWALVEELCNCEPETVKNSMEDAWGAHLAAQAIVETADLAKMSEANRKKVIRIKRCLENILIITGFPPRERAAAGVNLAFLGDERPGVITTKEMQFCCVPGGSFWMGEEEGMHQNETVAYDFWISRYPVTQAQFLEFTRDNGYKNEKYWKEAKDAGVWKDGKIKEYFEESFREELYRFGAPFTLPNHPVVGVTWYEALAFTRWLTERWKQQGILPEDWAVKLPSEAEWEKAARGGLEIPVQPHNVAMGDIEKNTRLSMKRNGASRRLYPWGNDPDPNRANYDETGIGATSAVGCFPGGASPYGCEEMSGNVWEWTRSLCNEYPYDPKDGRENLEALKNYARVVRGGLFNHYLRYARCPCRFWFNPGFWDDLRGFRVMLSPFISEL